MDYEKIIKDYRIGKDSRVVFKNDPRVYYVKNITPDRKGIFVTITGSENIYKRLSNLIKVDSKEIVKESMCKCGCNTCDTPKAPLLNESLIKRQALSEGLNYHVSKAIPLTENVYRAGSEKYFQLWKEARNLYVRDLLEVQGDDLDIILETDLGYTGLYEGKEVYLDFIFEEETTEFNINKVWDFIGSRPFYNKDYMPKFNTAEEIWDKWGPEEKQMYSNFEWEDTYGDKLHPRELAARQRQANYNALAGLNEAKPKKKNPPLGKPKRGGSKKFYVYVKDPKTKKVKKVSFGAKDGGQNLRVKLNDPKARRAFADRQNCDQKNDKTKPGYWSCRLPRYAKLLGLKSNFSGFW
jgi:hypothetical protein